MKCGHRRQLFPVDIMRWVSVPIMGVIVFFIMLKPGTKRGKLVFPAIALPLFGIWLLYVNTGILSAFLRFFFGDG